MYRMRAWSVRHSRGLKWLYHGVESVLVFLSPVWRWIGQERVDKSMMAVEKVAKGFLLDSQSCGQCIVGSTGLSCPMNCPKTMRNGPCGGVRANGKCEVKPDMDCVWVNAWKGNKNLNVDEYPIQVVQPAIDNRRFNKSAWFREVQIRTEHRHEV
ncbi:MAG: methylenetetrahydrofolate reductase C-terminal domain-containing protein [Pseudomonadota bacterium]